MYASDTLTYHALLAQYEAAWALTNLASAEHADAQDCVDQGAVPALVRLLGLQDEELVEQVGG